MNELLDFVIERHGGIDCWYEASIVVRDALPMNVGRHRLHAEAVGLPP